MIWTQSTASLGNFLYDWMHADLWQQRGLDIRCLVTPRMEPWLPIFGATAERLVVTRDQVRLTDRRERGLFADFGVSFDVPQLYAFIESVIAPVIDPTRLPADQRLTDRDVLVNVRRGDYFSVEAHRVRYAFDLGEYLDAALRRSREVGGPIDRIHVVSDDVAWCEQNLPGLIGDFPSRITFEDQGLPPQAHLALLADAPRLVLANSTFSYWGGYLSEWRHRRPEQIVAPRFHARDANDGAAWQLDPRWSIVRDLPSNWSLPPD